MKDQQRAADLVESLNVTILQLHRVIDEMDSTEHLTRGPLGFLRWLRCDLFGHDQTDAEHRITCPRCGFLLR